MSRDYNLSDKYTLCYDMRALRRLESPEILGPLPRVMADPFVSGSITAQTSFLWAGLLRHHNVTIDEACDIMDDIGLEECGMAIKAAMAQAYPKLFPSDDGGDDDDGEGKPQS